MADCRDIPSTVGYYELVRTIGKGNFAVVKLARHSITNSKIAIKVISTRALDCEQLRKLYREIDIMKRIGSHKHILRLYQVMQSDKHVMLVTEFCAGGEIFDQLVANGRMSEHNARNYFHQIIDAVDFLHENGIVHRDLKAENLLLSADLKCVKLADFGFSNYYSYEALLSTWCGSPPYAAPELFEGKHYCGPKADIWSLGVVLYVLVCGALPFDGHTLSSLKSRVLVGKFRIPYFMSCDCEHLIRHMLITDPDKRFSLQQIKTHKWMRVSSQSEEQQHNNNNTADNNSTVETTTTSSESQHVSISSSVDQSIDMSIVEWVSNELSADQTEVLESVRTRAYDHYYALYHLVKDSSQVSPSSAPPSPPLLPVIPSTNQRKSSITTGIVERDTPSAPLLSAPSPHRRHTFGPDTNNQTSSSQTQLVTPPLLFLTPPTAPVMLPIGNLPLAPPNYPITNMDLLRPPPVLLMVNNNMGRRASDGQANYTRTSVESSHHVTCSASAFNFPPTSSTQTSPPISYHRRKRHSLTDANDLVNRYGRRSGLANLINSSNNDRCRRRASDGSSVVTTSTSSQSQSAAKQQQISIASLQTELRALCVSSPPSLQTSPIHAPIHSSIVTNACSVASPNMVSGVIVTPNMSSQSLVPSSPPPTLPLISEELQMGGSTSPNACSPVPLLTPPQSFRSSPVTSPNTPSIAITDDSGTLQFPILPPPEFNDVTFGQTESLWSAQHVTSHPNLERGITVVTEDNGVTRLHRWRNEESRRDSYITCRTLRQTYPPTTQLQLHNNNNATQPQQQPQQQQLQQHYTSLQTLRNDEIMSSQLRTTGSGSIILEDFGTATKLLRRLEGKERRGEKGHIIMFDDNDIQISIEWNDLRKQLVLRRVSGDANQYNDVCRELIANIM